MSYYETVEDEVVSEGEEESEEEEEPVVVVPKRRKVKKWKVSYIFEDLHFCFIVERTMVSGWNVELSFYFN